MGVGWVWGAGGESWGGGLGGEGGRAERDGREELPFYFWGEGRGELFGSFFMRRGRIEAGGGAGGVRGWGWGGSARLPERLYIRLPLKKGVGAGKVGFWGWAGRGGFSGGEAPPGELAPAGSNRSSHGGNEMAKPSDSVSRIGGSASVQAATQVNAVQTSKRTMWGPTWPSDRGRLIRLGDRAKTTPSRRTGVVAAACTQGKRTQHGKPQGVARDGQPDAREGQAGRPGVAERPVIPLKPGNAGEGRGLSSRLTQDARKGLEIGQPINSEQRSETADGVTRKSEG